MPVPPPRDAAQAIKGDRFGAKAVIFEVKCQRVLAGRKLLRTFPANPLEIEQIPGEDRLAFHKVEAPTAKPAPLGHDHAFGTFRWNFDVSGYGVGRVEKARGIAQRDASHRSGVAELHPARRDVRPRRHETCEPRGI
jgi:hypothetical protein